MVKKVNIGLIGFKFMGKAHSHAYKDIPMFFRLRVVPVMKAICGPIEEKEELKEAAQRYGWENYEVSWEKLVKRDDVDLVDIAAPTNIHKEITLAAAKEGKDIFCEKSLALTLDDAREMLQAVKEAGVKHMIGFSYRMTPAIMLAKRIIEEGRIGRVFHYRAFFLQDWLVDPNFPLVWRLRKKIAGSGALGDMGSHLIDMARFLMGEFEEVIGVSKTFIEERPKPVSMTGLTGIAGKGKGKVTVDDSTLFLAKFKCGALGTFETTRYGTGRRSKNGFEINGSKGSLVFNFEHMNRLQFYSLEDPPHLRGFRDIMVTEDCHPYMKAWWPAGHGIGYEHTFIHELYELMEYIGKDEMPVPNFIDGVKCQEVQDAIERSINEKRWIKV